MNNVILKPSFWKIATMWIGFGFVVLLVIFIMEPNDFSDLRILGLSIVFMVVRCLIMTVIFYLIPYYHIEVTDISLVGPGSVFGGWYRVKIPLTDFETSKVKATIPSLGFYQIDFDGFGKITVWWFGKKRLQKLLAVIAARKGV